MFLTSNQLGVIESKMQKAASTASTDDDLDEPVFMESASNTAVKSTPKHQYDLVKDPILVQKLMNENVRLIDENSKLKKNQSLILANNKLQDENEKLKMRVTKKF
jgi:hypothetical protein